jgi:hypothetical protein
VVDWDYNEHDQPLWSDFKEIFKQEYAVQTNKRLILEGLANFAMKPNERTNELLTRITHKVRVIKESGSAQQHQPRDLQPDLSDVQKTIHGYDVQLLQDELIQACSDAGTQSCRGKAGSGSHDGQKDVHVCNHCPMRRQDEAASRCQRDQ